MFILGTRKNCIIQNDIYLVVLPEIQDRAIRSLLKCWVTEVSKQNFCQFLNYVWDFPIDFLLDI